MGPRILVNELVYECRGARTRIKLATRIKLTSSKLIYRSIHVCTTTGKLNNVMTLYKLTQ